MICFVMPLFYINYYRGVMFKKQVSWTDAGQKFVHPIRKGDILKNYNECQVFDACSSLN